MKQRINQFIKSLTAKVTKDDYDLVNQYIGEQIRLKELFLLLPVFEQRHCIDVAQTIQNHFSEDLNQHEKQILMQAALLHDIGKLNMGLNPVTKSVAVIFDKINKESAKRLTGKMKFMNGYYNHPEIGAEILRKCDVSEEIVNLVANHHNRSTKYNDKLQETLIRADELN